LCGDWVQFSDRYEIYDSTDFYEVKKGVLEQFDPPDPAAPTGGRDTCETRVMSDESTDRVTGSATTTVQAPVGDVFAAVTDVTRMGEWSPECVGCRWIGGADGAAVGARFEGDNVAKLGPITLKRWTTTSEVVDVEPNSSFEFKAEGYTTWRYEFAERDGATVVTESFSYPPYAGWQKWVYGRLLNRQKAMMAGMQATLDRIEQSLEH
jgi:uncharacterized protein YndB with AHSA1/START domain